MIKRIAILISVWTCVLASKSVPTVKPARNIVITLLNSTSTKVSWTKPEDVEAGSITHYRVHVRQVLHDSIEMRNWSVKPTLTNLIMTKLSPNILYQVKIETVYKNKYNSWTKEKLFTTNSTDENSFCLCDPYGSINSTQFNGTCAGNVLHCHCRENYRGSHCSICSAGHYRRPYSYCERCPCFQNTSNGQCSFNLKLGRAMCHDCKKNRMGPLCELCVNGYYLDGGNPDAKCVPCKCPKMAGEKTAYCNRINGHCAQCPNGTLGKFCEECAPGWHGDAPHCYLGALPAHSSITVVTALVALIAVAIALLLGYWAMRVRARRKRLNAWSLELNRYESEQPGLVDSGSHSGLMMEEAPPPTAITGVASNHHNSYGGARLQLRQSELNMGDEGRNAGQGKPVVPLV